MLETDLVPNTGVQRHSYKSFSSRQNLKYYKERVGGQQKLQLRARSCSNARASIFGKFNEMSFHQAFLQLGHQQWPWTWCLAPHGVWTGGAVVQTSVRKQDGENLWELIKRDKILPGRDSCQIYYILGNHFRLCRKVLVEREQEVLPDFTSNIVLQLFLFFFGIGMVINYLLSTKLNTGQRELWSITDERPQHNDHREMVIHNVIRPCFSWACKACYESSRHDHQSQEIYIHIPALLLATCWSWDKFLACLCFGFPLAGKDATIPSSAAKNINATLMFGDRIKESGRDLSSNTVLLWIPPHQQILALTWRPQLLGQLPQRWLVGETAVHFFMQTQPRVLTKEVFEVASSIKHGWKNKLLAGVWSLSRHPSTPAVSALHYHRGKPTPQWL